VDSLSHDGSFPILSQFVGHNNLQRAVFTLKIFIKLWNGTITRKNLKRWHFYEKILGDKKCLEQVKDFEYLGCEISYKNEEMYSTNVSKFVHWEF
jgi:hypothetical protein